VVIPIFMPWIRRHPTQISFCRQALDRRSIYLPPAELHGSLYSVPEQLENKSRDEYFWELGKFLVLALKANSNV
jgi:RNA repair pathway DNA polymerase beta family